MSKKLTLEFVALKTKNDRLQSITKLNLWGCDLNDVSLFSQMPQLEIVSLSINKLNTLKDFKNMHYLRELSIRKNLISDFRELKYLSTCPNLRNLWLGENPISDDKNYRLIVLNYLPNLEKLDDVVISDREREDALNFGNYNNSNNNNINEYEELDEEGIKYSYKREGSPKRMEGYNRKTSGKNRNYDDNEMDVDSNYMSKRNGNIDRDRKMEIDEDFYESRNENYNKREVGSFKIKQTGNFNYPYEEKDEGYNKQRYQNLYKSSQMEPRQEKHNRFNVKNRELYENEEIEQGREIERKRESEKSSNVLKSLLILIKELNFNELQEVEREIDKKLSNY